VSAEDLIYLINNINISLCNSTIEIDSSALEIAYRLCIDVEKIDEKFFLMGDKSLILLSAYKELKSYSGDLSDKSALDLMNEVVQYEVRPSVSYRIGARMGKPEGAKLRDETCYSFPIPCWV
jgi:hypothetical protein